LCKHTVCWTQVRNKDTWLYRTLEQVPQLSTNAYCHPPKIKDTSLTNVWSKGCTEWRGFTILLWYMYSMEHPKYKLRPGYCETTHGIIWHTYFHGHGVKTCYSYVVLLSPVQVSNSCDKATACSDSEATHSLVPRPE